MLGIICLKLIKLINSEHYDEFSVPDIFIENGLNLSDFNSKRLNILDIIDSKPKSAEMAEVREEFVKLMK